MNINKDNYEAIFLDYYEGVLSSDEIEEMFVFISQHPEVKAEFEEFEMISVHPDNGISFTNKESLKKNMNTSIEEIGLDNYEEFLIMELEGLLNEEKSLKLQSFIAAHPEIEKEKKLFAHTRLSPDANVRFQQKESLKHKAISFGEIDENNFEDYFISDTEGNLTPEQKIDLNEFLLLNPELVRSHKIYGMTKLQPDLSIVFENKSSLLKSVVPIRRLVYYSLSAAASIIILLGIYFRFQDSQTIRTASNDHHPATLSKSAVNTTPVSGKQPGTSAKSVHLASNTIGLPEEKKHRSPAKPSTVSGKQPADESGRNLLAMESVSPRSYNEIISHDYVAPEFMFIRTSQMHTNDYMELYYNVRLSEQILYAQLNQKDDNPEKTILTSMSAYAGKFLGQKDKDKGETVTKNAVSVWTFAELGVKTYNRIAQDNVKLDLQRDEQGKVVSYNLFGDKLDLQRDVDK